MNWWPFKKKARPVSAEQIVQREALVQQCLEIERATCDAFVESSRPDKPYTISTRSAHERAYAWAVYYSRCAEWAQYNLHGLYSLAWNVAAEHRKTSLYNSEYTDSQNWSDVKQRLEYIGMRVARLREQEFESAELSASYSRYANVLMNQELCDYYTSHV